MNSIHREAYRKALDIIAGWGTQKQTETNMSDATTDTDHTGVSVRWMSCHRHFQHFTRLLFHCLLYVI